MFQYFQRWICYKNVMKDYIANEISSSEKVIVQNSVNILH